MRRKEWDEYAEAQKLLRVRSFINNNVGRFYAGSEFGEDVILDAFDVTQPDFTGMGPAAIIKANRSYEHKRNQWQNRFNRLLAQCGLYMTKKYQEPLWHIKTLGESEAKVANFETDALRKTFRARELNSGINVYRAVYDPAALDDQTLNDIAKRSDPSNWTGSGYIDPDHT